jgi:hypothetical protein
MSGHGGALSLWCQQAIMRGNSIRLANDQQLLLTDYMPPLHGGFFCPAKQVQIFIQQNFSKIQNADKKINK